MSTVTLKGYKLARLKRYAEQYGVDILIASLHENITYMTDFTCVGGTMLHRTQTYSVMDMRNENASLIIGYGEAVAAYERLGDYRYYCYGPFRYDCVNNPEGLAEAVRDLEQACFEDAGAALVQAIRDCGLSGGRIGLDESIATIQLWNYLRQEFPQYEFIPAAFIFSEARKIKHSEEILCLECAAEIAEKSIDAVVRDMHVGMTEKQMEARFNQEVYALGGSPFFCVATIDIRTANVDTVNTDLGLTADSHVRFDLGCDYMGYKSDISRTVAIGGAAARIKDMYSWIREGEIEAIKSMRPGIACKEVFDTAVRTVRRGIPNYRRSHCGHGIGLEIYDSPSVAPDAQDELEENMVLCIETPYYILGWGGVQVEDTLQVTGNGTYRLTKTSGNLIEIQF